MQADHAHFDCSCGAHFDSRTAFEAHKVKAHGAKPAAPAAPTAKPFRCDCGESFATQALMKEHARVAHRQ